MIATTMIPGIASAATTTGSPATSSNLSANPTLARGTFGYRVASGGTDLRRVTVTDHVAATEAAQVSSTATTTRLLEPRESVVASQTFSFASDVKATNAGSAASVSVSWFTAAGRFLSYDEGRFVPVNNTTWSRTFVSAIAPRHAAIARSQVNVINTAPKALVTVTQHDVRMVSAGGVAAPASAPPTAATPTTVPPTTVVPTTARPTTVVPTTARPTTVAPTTVPPTTVVPTTAPPTTVVPTTAPPTTVAPTTVPPTTVVPRTVPPTTAAPAPAPPVSGSVVFNGDFAAGNFAQYSTCQTKSFNGACRTMPDNYSLSIEPGHQSKFAARIEVRDGDQPFCCGERAQLVAYDTRETEGKDYWYDFSFMIDQQFPITNSWQTLLEWHSDIDGSPPLGVMVEGNNLVLQTRPRANAPYTGITDIWTTPFVKGQWMSLKLHVKWSGDPNVGFAQIWKNGAPQTFVATPPENGNGTSCIGQQTCRFRNIYPGDPGNRAMVNYYRDPSISGTGVVHVDNFDVATAESALTSARSAAAGG